MGKFLRVKYIIIAVIFLFVTCGGVAAAFIFGEDVALSAVSYGSGTESDPYRIYSSSQINSLQEISSSGRSAELTGGKYFLLCADVNVNNSYGDYYSLHGFGGVLDGAGHTVTTQSKPLFGRIQKGSAVKNVNFKLKGKVKIKAVHNYHFAAVAECADSGSLIENCRVYGDIDFALFSNKGVSVQVGGITAGGGGTVKDCSFNGNISHAGEALLATLYMSGISGGFGKVENCEFNGNIICAAWGIKQQWAGISYNGKNKNCAFNGSIVQERGNKYAIRTLVYGIGQSAEDCVFNGDISNAHTRKFAVCLIAGEGSTFTHNGKLPAA